MAKARASQDAQTPPDGPNGGLSTNSLRKSDPRSFNHAVANQSHSFHTASARHVRDNLLGMIMPDLLDEGYDLPEPAPLSGDMPDPSTFHTALGKMGDFDLRGYIRDIEVAMIEAALDKRTGNVAQAADMLRLRRTTLIEKMKKYGIRRGLEA